MSDPVDPNPSFEQYLPAIGQYGYDPGGYAPSPPPYPGYPGRPRYPVGDDRPGAVVAASTLALLSAVLLIFAGLLLLAGVSLNSALRGAESTQDSFWLGLACVINFASAGLAIAAVVLLLGRRALGRPMLCAAAALDVGAAIGWLTQDSSTLFFGVICAGPIVIAAALTWQRSLSAWLSLG